MAEKTKIAYVDATVSPWTGCTEVSPGCLNCFAKALAKRYGWCGWGRERGRHQFLSFSDTARRMNNQRTNPPRRRRIFPSLMDWLDEDVPSYWLLRFLLTIRITQNVDWLLLTKRPARWRARLTEVLKSEQSEIYRPIRYDIEKWLEGEPWYNIWVGTSIEDQPRADERIPQLLSIPAKVHFLSCEPLLGPIKLPLHSRIDIGHQWMGDKEATTAIDWVVIGGESGPGARPCETEWIRDIVQQCRVSGVAPYVKQLGSHAFDGYVKMKLKHPKGGDPAEWSEDLRVREFPENEPTNH